MATPRRVVWTIPARLTFVLLVPLVLFPLTALSEDSGQADIAAVVRQFVDAFNAHDADAMAALVSDDVKWLSVDGNSVSIEVEGKTALVEAMAGYFQSCPTCRSTIRGLVASRERVSVVEEATWVGSKGPRSQRAMAVYEISGSLITSVYYFPEEVQE